MDSALLQIVPILICSSFRIPSELLLFVFFYILKMKMALEESGYVIQNNGKKMLQNYVIAKCIFKMFCLVFFALYKQIQRVVLFYDCNV